MAGLTPLGVSVLALLSEREMHPYEMYQLIRERHEDRVVKLRPGSLYHTVERLAEQELIAVSGTARAGNRPERTSYTILPDGRALLTERICELLRTPANEYPQFPLALSEAHHLTRDQVIGLLRERLDQLNESIEENRTLISGATDDAVPEAYWFGADYIQAMLTAERDWVDRCVTRLENKELAWPNKRN